MALFRKIFRYPAVDFYMFFSCIIAFVALFIALSIFNEAWYYEKDQEQLRYLNVYMADLVKTQNFDPQMLSELSDCNLSLSDVLVELSYEEGKISTLAQVMIKDRDFIYPFVEGSYPEIRTKQCPICLVGRDIIKLTGKKVGESILIDGAEYEVCGVIGTDRSAYLDGRIILWADHLAPQTKEHIRMYDTVSLLFESNHIDTYKCYQRIYSELKDREDVLSLNGTGNYIDENYGKNRTEAYFYIILYAFALLHCVIASDIWAYERQYELAVKKIYGFSSKQLIFDLFRQLFFLTLTAAIGCLVIQGCFLLFGRSLFGIEMKVSWRNMGLVLAFTVLTTVIGLLRPIRMVEQNEAIGSVLNKRDGI